MIESLEEKLAGNIPINKLELIELINSWGRLESRTITNNMFLNKSLKKECYPLENLDVTQIDDLSFIFYGSIYNGDKRFKNNNSLLFLNF